MRELRGPCFKCLQVRLSFLGRRDVPRPPRSTLQCNCGILYLELYPIPIVSYVYAAFLPNRLNLVILFSVLISRFLRTSHQSNAKPEHQVPLYPYSFIYTAPSPPPKECLTSTMSTTAKLGFLDLPGEIRNRIYSHLFIHYPAVNPRPDTGGNNRSGPYNRNAHGHMCRLNDSVCPWLSPRGLNQKYETESSPVSESDSWDRPVKEDDIPISGILSLLVTCRQIYEEAGDLFFRMNTFSFDSAHLVHSAIAALAPSRLALIRSVETHVDLETRGNAFWRGLFFQGLEALHKLPNLQSLYISIAVPCKHQRTVKTLLDKVIPDFTQPGLAIVVEETYCTHCEENRLRRYQGYPFLDEGHEYHQAWFERQWWIWRRDYHSRHSGFQALQRFGEEEIDLIGEHWRGRAKDARWKERYDEESEKYLDCLVDRQHCISCGMNGKYLHNGLERCPRCRLAGYCSTRCMKEDWRSHSLSCVPSTFH